MIAEPRLEACYFSPGENGPWRRMSRVLAMTAAEHCPRWTVQVRQIATDRRLASPMGIARDVHNTQKLDAWHAVVAAAEDGDQLLLVDADTFILRPLDPVWDQAFDLAYTVKGDAAPEHRFPFNGGVVFLRVSGRTRALMSAWRDENRRMLSDPIHHQRWRKRFGGINQAAFGCLLAQGVESRLQVATLPCLEWNCEDANWARFDPAVTRIVHVKGALRRALFQGEQPSAAVRRVADLWLERDAEASTAEEQARAS